MCTSAARMPLGVPLPGRAVPGEAGEAPERVVVTSRLAAAGAVSVVEASDWSAMLLPLAATRKPPVTGCNGISSGTGYRVACPKAVGGRRGG